jgi:hypothetical protein
MDSGWLVADSAVDVCLQLSLATSDAKVALSGPFELFSVRHCCSNDCRSACKASWQEHIKVM